MRKSCCDPVEISAAVNRARSEAGCRAAAVSICASTDGSTCRTDGVADWSRGWLVVADTNRDGRWQSTETMLAVTQIA